jgi:hypothetical protein
LSIALNESTSHEAFAARFASVSKVMHGGLRHA